MSIQILHLRHHHRDSLVQMWKAIHPDEKLSAESVVDAAIRTPLKPSVVAMIADAIVGAVLCCRDANGYICRAAVDPAHHNDALVRQLMNKVYARMVRTSANRCRFVLPAHKMDDAFWQSVAWTGDGDNTVGTPDARKGFEEAFVPEALPRLDQHNQRSTPAA